MQILKKLFFILLSLIVFSLGLYMIVSDSVSIDPGWDKFCHFGGFFAVTLIFSVSFMNLVNIRNYFYHYLTSVCLLGGIFIALLEVLQEKFSLNRESDPVDWLAGLVGMAVAVLIIYLYTQYHKKKGQKDDL